MQDDSAASHAATQPAIQPRTEHPRLVIADDSSEIRWLVRATVGEQFAEVVEVSDGRQLMWTLLQLFMSARDQVPEIVVITDVCMPTYDGLAVLDAWTELGCDVPLIIITAFPSALVHARAQELGAIVLAKPFSTAALRRLIGEIIVRRTATSWAPLPA
jgi:two-component system response regulator AtoC